MMSSETTQHRTHQSRQQESRTEPPEKEKAILNWSGGKDSSLCLHHCLQAGEHEITALFTTVNERYRRISSHGVRLELLRLQAAAIGLPLRTLMLPDSPTMESYNKAMGDALEEIRSRGVTSSIFGDIFLEDLRAYRESRLAELDMRGHFPLWKRDTQQLAKQFVKDGFRAVVVCVDDRKLDESFVGRSYDESFLADLPENVDPCGEHGEFHTFVHDGPVFEHPVAHRIGEKVYRSYEPPKRDPDGDEEGYRCGEDEENDHRPTGFWYCDLLPAGD